ncbi:MAG: hypothetical protein PUE95_06555 [Lachnospiraceae bacterium]|nr:hypothetical protein [Lachnospiraceae bacterium]MDD6656937.1 hypothetical protein [Lachnospiraceae bacterium]
MKVWKLVSGIISIVLCLIIELQSCAAGVVNTIEENGGSSGSVGFLCGILILAGGIVSIASRKSAKNGGNIALIVLFGLAALLGFTGYGNYSDLVIWSIWALVNAVLAVVALVKNKNSI